MFALQVPGYENYTGMYFDKPNHNGLLVTIQYSWIKTVFRSRSFAVINHISKNYLGGVTTLDFKLLKISSYLW